MIFCGLAIICLMVMLGLAYSISPDIIIGRLDVWESAAATESLQFVFWRVLFTLPVIIGYTLFSYRTFHGKTQGLSYE
ncbi:MAG: cytochrome d ubiquinol oxidase subunit II [Porticoccaceae bacterium]|nr:cytochrome d ubiquinol oxidase subunit II [Porticoccaceae bacterium]